MRPFAFALSALGILALAAAAQEAVTIKVAYPKPGEKSRVTVDDKMTTKTTFTVQGQTQSKDDANVKSFVYVDEILENPKNAKRATKLKRTYEKATLTTGGNAVKLPVEGKTVLIEKTGEKYSYTVDGQEVAGDALRILRDEFDRPDGKDMRDVVFPKTPVKPGESWKIDAAVLAKAIADTGPVFDTAKSTAAGKLVKAYQKDGRQFGVIEFVFEGPITGFGGKQALTVSEGKMTVKLSGDGCIDGTAATGKSTMKMSLQVNGSTQGIDLKIAVDGTENRTVEALPRK
jgi:hypothetical protein